MKALITGAAGYIGSGFARMLIKRNFQVDLIDNYYLPSNIKDIEGIPIQHKDIRDPDLNLESYDILIHLAAIAGIKRCEEDKSEAHSVNTKGVFNLLKTFKGRIVFASTSAVYGQTQIPEITEQHPAMPRNHYGDTKLQAEGIVKLHDNYCILRFSNIYGKEILCKRTVVDLFIENALKGENLTIHGDGKQRRDFVNIKDVLRALWYGMNAEVNDTFNVGGNEALSINDIAELVIKAYRQLFGTTPAIKRIPIDGGVVWKDFIYSSERAKTYLNYEPSWSVSDEIRNRLSAHKKSGVRNG